MATIVYHGSPNKFTQFSYDNMRTNATSEGVGFYFTDNKEIATGYASESTNNGKYNGYLYTVEFNGKKSLSSDKKTITKVQLKKFLKALNQAILNSNDENIDYLSNYNDVEYYGIERVLTEAVNMEYDNNTNDVDLIAGICNASGNFEITLITLYKTLHYDSIVLTAEWGQDESGVNQQLYIALVNEAIKILNIEQITK